MKYKYNKINLNIRKNCEILIYVNILWIRYTSSDIGSALYQYWVLDQCQQLS